MVTYTVFSSSIYSSFLLLLSLSNIARQWRKSLDRCSTSGGQSRVRAPIDWCLRVLDRSLISQWSVALVNRLRWSRIYPCSFLCRQNVSRFLHEISVVTLYWSRLASIIQSNDFCKSIDVSRDMRWISIGFSSFLLNFFSISFFDLLLFFLIVIVYSSFTFSGFLFTGIFFVNKEGEDYSF